ncbi:hypothetical protein SDRG_00947, partial [Saprolegnia diclina VS20]
TGNPLVDYYLWIKVPGDKLVDYYLWIKVPGESDGQCYGQSGDAMIGPGAGQFFADGFKSLWDQGYFVAHGFPKIGQTTGSPTMAPTSTPALTTKTPSPSTPQPSVAHNTGSKVVDYLLWLKVPDNTGSKVVDYLLWLKVPGESDGQCYGQSSDSSVGPGAGQFFPDGFQ